MPYYSAMICLLCRSSRVEVVWRQVRGAQGLDFHSCSECGLLFKDPAVFQTLEQQKAHYLCHNNDPSDSRYQAYLMRLAGPLMSQLAPHAEGLDFGCGPSTTMAALFQRAGFSCESYDPCFFPRVEVLQHAYDFVTCSEVVEHFHDPDREFEKLVRLLKPGGRLAIMTQSPPLDLASWPYHLDVTHVVFFSKSTFRWIAAKYGLSAAFFPHGVTILHRSR